jgi:hypothetical protein
MPIVRMLACLVPWLVACTSPGADAPRAPAAPAAFSVAQDYEGAYRRVLENARRCWPASASTGQRDVQGTLDNDAKAAHLAFAFRSRGGTDAHLLVDLNAADRVRTDVRITGPASSAAAVRGWLEGTSVDCP